MSVINPILNHEDPRFRPATAQQKRDVIRLARRTYTTIPNIDALSEQAAKDLIEAMKIS